VKSSRIQNLPLLKNQNSLFELPIDPKKL